MNYFFKKNNVTLGPIPLADLLKIIDSDTEVSEDGSQWVLAKDLPALANALGVGRPIGPPPLPTSKSTPPPPIPPPMPRHQVTTPLHSPVNEKSGGLSFGTILVGIVLIGLLIFAGLAYMDGPGNTSSYTPSGSINLDDYNQDVETSTSKSDELPTSEIQAPEEIKPQKTQCITCDGSREVEKTCDLCRGEGVTHRMDGAETYKCSQCNGSGSKFFSCDSCDGDGWVND